MTIDLVNVLDSKCLLRMLEMAFQSIKISKLSRGAGPHPLAAHAFGSSVIHRWLKNILIYILKRLDSLLSSWPNFSPWPLKMHFLPSLFLSPKTSRKISPNNIGRCVTLSHNLLECFPHIRLWHDNPPSVFPRWCGFAYGPWGQLCVQLNPTLWTQLCPWGKKAFMFSQSHFLWTHQCLY